MIRSSLAIAAAAVVVSLLIHASGLAVSAVLPPPPPAPKPGSNSVAVGNAFEDLAEPALEASRLEEQEVPEPPVEETPIPEEAEAPTSEVKVASENPQQDVFAPDTGSLDYIEPVKPESNGPETPEQSLDEVTSLDGPDPTAPVETAPELQAPVGAVEDAVEVEEAPVTETAETSPPVAVAPVSDATVELAALPEPTVPVIPVEKPDTVDTSEPQQAEPEETVESDAELAALDDTAEPDALPSVTDLGLPESFAAFDDLLFPSQLEDSPVDAYKRERKAAIAAGGFGIQPGNTASALGPGNSDETNYAGRALVHLNRTPPVYVNARGFARVFFEINPDGSVAWVDVTDSSGSREIDQAAREQIQRAAPFPLPPGGKSRKMSFFYAIR